MPRIPLLSLASIPLFAIACGGIPGESYELDPEIPVEGITDPDYTPPPDPCDGLDNNVDGTVDEGCYCQPGSVQTCFAGDPENAGVGACTQMGIQRCVVLHGDLGKGHWSTCQGSAAPSPELCGNTIDEDCDGFAAPCENGDVTGLPCHPGESQRCYDGPPGTEGFGRCTAGVRFCGERNLWGPCEDSVVPTQEICDSGEDEDCDGSELACP